MQKKPSKRGGARPGAGKKQENPELGRRVKRAITLRPDHDELIKTNRSKIIEKALDLLFTTGQA